nr:DJ-1/PfpI family protein [Komagataeibacter xylinus]
MSASSTHNSSPQAPAAHGTLAGRRIAFLATNGVEEVELSEPAAALRAAGAHTVLVAPEAGEIQAMKADVNPTRRLHVDMPVSFVRAFVQADKPIAAICHGAWTLINAEGVRGHTLTSWPSLRVDLTNAGAHWVDRDVVRDGMLVTSRNPHDLKAFCPAIIALFAKAPHRAAP